MRSLQKLFFPSVVIGVFLSACATTTLTAVWKDDTYTAGVLKKVMVLAVLENPVHRKIVESVMAEELKRNGVEGIASSTALGSELSENTIMEAAKENHVDGLMAVRLIGMDQAQVYHPPTYTVPFPYYYAWGTYYPHMHDHIGMPGYIATYKYYHVESNVYATKTEKLIWSAASETVNPTSINKDAREFSRKIVRSLKAGQII